MGDLTRAYELIAEIRERLAQLETELARQRAESSRAAPAPLAAPPERDLPHIILPTPTDDPDSIVGGRRTLAADFQDCCAVGNRDSYYCSGTLIAPQVVVTAKHCLNATRVFLKGNDVRRARAGETIACRAVPHPDDDVDLQVLILERPSTVKPRRVARDEDLAGVTEATLVGFGTIDLSGTFGYGVKRQVEVPLRALDYSDPDEMDRYGCQGDIEIVAGHRGLRKDSCRGDSGGPLYIRGADGGYCLLGATSRGVLDTAHMCGDGGVYVRVHKFLDWIREVTGAEM